MNYANLRQLLGHHHHHCYCHHHHSGSLTASNWSTSIDCCFSALPLAQPRGWWYGPLLQSSTWLYPWFEQSELGRIGQILSEIWTQTHGIKVMSTERKIWQPVYGQHLLWPHLAANSTKQRHSRIKRRCLIFLLIVFPRRTPDGGRNVWQRSLFLAYSPITLWWHLHPRHPHSLPDTAASGNALVQLRPSSPCLLGRWQLTCY